MEIYELRPADGKWTIHAEGFPRTLGVFNTKAEAVTATGAFLWRRCGAMRVYDGAGNIEEERTFHS